jgi:hypothetical protein
MTPHDAGRPPPETWAATRPPRKGPDCRCGRGRIGRSPALQRVLSIPSSADGPVLDRPPCCASMLMSSMQASRIPPALSLICTVAYSRMSSGNSELTCAPFRGLRTSATPDTPAGRVHNGRSGGGWHGYEKVSPGADSTPCLVICHPGKGRMGPRREDCCRVERADRLGVKQFPRPSPPPDGPRYPIPGRHRDAHGT